MHLYNFFLKEKDGGREEGELRLLQKGENDEKSLIKERHIKWFAVYSR